MTNEMGEYLYQQNPRMKQSQKAKNEVIELLNKPHPVSDAYIPNTPLEDMSTHELVEYIKYRIKNAKDMEEKQYYESLLKMLVDDIDNQSSAYVPISNNNAYVPLPVDNTVGYENIQPTTVDNDLDLQEELHGTPADGPQDSRDLDLNASEWGGMESGAIQYNSTQSPNWWSTIPDEYKVKAVEWASNQGILEIIPIQQRQKFTYTTVAYIAHNTAEPKTQRIPISDVSVVPHQIHFDFYDTTEGRVGVSHASEKHMSVEFDVYLTDYIFYNWNSGGDNTNQYYMDVPDKIKKTFWKAVENKEYINSNFFSDIEATKEFSDFRMSFLQQHLGWVCKFNTHVFPTFFGVINDISFSINSGETFAKWHVKIEEAIFVDYNKDGKKPSEDSTVSEDGSTTDSGDAEITENIQTG